MTTRWLFGDQLGAHFLDDHDGDVLMVESKRVFARKRYHRAKAHGTVRIAWTDDEFLTEGIVVAPGSTQDDVAALYDWWRQNSAYQG